MRKFTLSFLFIYFAACSSSNDIREKNATAENPRFSLSDLQNVKDVKPAPTEFIQASDGVRLAYRSYIPAKPAANLIFYHGGGAHSGAGYQHLATKLRDQYRVAVFTPDLRGHGDSEGDRGDCPGAEQVWGDIGSMVQHIRKTQIGPTFLGGHSSGAGVVLNYSSWENKTAIDGYVFLSPQLGPRSRTARKDRENPFVTVKVQYFVLNSMTIGLGFGHRAAVIFNYPPEVLANDAGMVGSNTVNMANALTPLDPEGQFEELDRPFGMWIGSKDELMVPEKVIAYADMANYVRQKSKAKILIDERHLTVLLTGHNVIGQWIKAKKNNS